MGLFSNLVSGVVSKKAVDFVADWLVKMRWLRESEKSRFSSDLLKVVQGTIELESGKSVTSTVTVGIVRKVSTTPVFGKKTLVSRVGLFGKKKS